MRKTLLSSAFFLFLISCGGEDKDLLKAQISIHNERAATAYQAAALKAEEGYQIQYLNQPQADRLIQLQMENFSREWNDPYTIEKDSTLTYESVTEYCKKNSLDKEKFLAELNIKQ